MLAAGAVAVLLQVPFVLVLRVALLGSAGAPLDPDAPAEHETQLVAVADAEAPPALPPPPPVDELAPPPDAPPPLEAPSPTMDRPPEPVPVEPIEVAEPDPEPEPEPEPRPEPPPPRHEIAIAQAESNDVEPVDTRHAADRANTVVEETLAAQTTLRDPGDPETGGDDAAPEGPDAGSDETVHGEDAPATEQADAAQSEQVTGDPDEASRDTPRPPDAPLLAAAQPDPRPPDRPRPPVSPVDPVEPVAPSEAGAPAGPDPGPAPSEPVTTGLSLRAQLEQARQTFEANPEAAELIAGVSTPDASDWVEVFGERDARDRLRLEREAREASLTGDHRADAQRTHAALMNFGAQARTGTETHLNARADSTAGYIHHLHSYIHPEWEAYLMRLEVTLGPGSVMADPDLHTRLEWVIAGDGHVRNVAVIESSGQILFDMEAINLLYRLDPVRPPPTELRSPDGNTYVHWSFRRDQRMCFTGGASVRFVGATEFGDEGAAAPL